MENLACRVLGVRTEVVEEDTEGAERGKTGVELMRFSPRFPEEATADTEVECVEMEPVERVGYGDERLLEAM